MNDDHLIIFIKNPFLNNLDKEVENKKHLLPLFIELLQHTAELANELNVNKHLYYDKFIANDRNFEKIW